MQQDSDKPGPMIRGGGRGQVTGQSVPTMLLAQFLSEQVGRTVLDKTGLTGKYDFSLQWTPDESLQQRGPGDGPERDLLPPVDQNGPSIFTALQDQLGLRLESQKAPVEVIVIDSVQKASEN